MAAKDHGHGNDHDHHGHDHDHAHRHAHAHGHVHLPATFGRAFAIGIALNLGFVIVEAGYGIVANSMALLADAGHNLSDVLGLCVAWLATVLARRRPSARFTYGFRASSILAALFNAAFLLVAVGAIAWEAVLRLADPSGVEIAAPTVMAVAAVGIAINGATAWLFARGRERDLNIRGAYLHMLADAAISAGVVLSGLGMLLTGWTWIDGAVGLAVCAAIVWGTLGLLRESVALSLAAVPAGVDAKEVRAFLASQPGVAGLHDLHIWALGTDQTALSAHLVMPAGPPGDAFLGAICAQLRARFSIAHATIQIETDANACALAACGAA
jgi:cobalt-zinc-cadmium efflux system protein